VYARASGYVHKWNVDIGDKVKEGEVLAEIDTPDLDQQIDEAKATQTRMDASVVQSKASLTFSKQTLERTEAMVKNGVASTQELDQRRTQAQVDEANVTVAIATADAQRANLRRLMSLKQFSHVTAPFAGTVTERKAERGMLLTAGTGNPLFKIATIDPARVFIQVPQDVAPSIHPDLAAQVSVREFPGRTFDGKVARASGALDPQTRTMMTEIRVPNPKGELLSGMYAQIALSLPIPHHVFELPATAIQTDANGVRVATVTADGTVKLVRVVVERDTGPTVLIASGLDGTERVAKLASAELVDGRQVDIAK